ncbi:CPBP family intramembrane glutamic endopeptidase [Gilvimarinus sp. 1_MG-2023]|uniref:CPBP family intramembrane glutamic endopeptidase n=1 Tax=Gilvimarinus sp. 1_MG-2023 TaxID=3062638 RepID=UPI0026E2065E|nr:CPBP family glutamic-type intramembrane protease [Gilvimarinus sp. 1_MG-2023]MDO6748374.1 CPBP family glutamic-type intramembrane protease [Gilvimarinus sp. 1_MG-2023]
MNRKTFWLLTLFEGGLGVVAFIILCLTHRPIPLLGSTGPSAWAWGIIGALLTYVALASGLRFWPYLQRKLTGHIQQLRQLFMPLTVLQFALMATLAGLGEELLFRVLLQSWLDSWMPISLAIIFSSLIFAAMHWLSLTYFILTLIMSIAFGLVYHATQSYVLVATWHGLYDFIALVVLTRQAHWLLPTTSR